MANALDQSPIYIDTAFTSYKAAVAAVLGTLFQLRVFSIRWVGPAASGQVLEFVDPSSGRQMYMMTSGANQQDVLADWSAAPRLWRDFGVPAVPSGKIFIDARM